MKKIKVLGKALSKNDQKHFAGGLREGGGGGGGWCLYCYGTGGACGSHASSYWTRSAACDPVAACEIVYSGCDFATGSISSGSCGGGLPE